jgi:mono/diheme cytochrome c family protein
MGMSYRLAIPLLVVLIVAAPSPAADAPAARTSTVQFNRDIRPILSDKCFQCHGADPKARKAELRLDEAAGATRPAASGGIAIVAGKPSESELFRRITSTDPDEQMPPKKSGKTLSTAEIARLKTWIEEGAKFERHWAFVPPMRPATPAVKNAKWCRNPIDFFILARLESAGLQPAAEADRITLSRRLSLDLTGLPPDIADVDAFVADQEPDAYRTVVDRLLDSPHYGERWARLWLDAARYADSDGYEKDKSRQVFFYRDWVINAFNRDLPFDQFVIEQIAGDLIPGATQDQRVATGFLRNSMINEEGGIDPEQFRMEAMFDRMDCVGKGVLGLTIQCAQCHTHKYDPITHDEYYRMLAFLNNSHEANPVVYTPAEQMKRDEVFREIKEVESELMHRHPDWPERMAAWEKKVANDQPRWTVIRPEIEEESTGGEKYYLLDDGSLLCQGYAPTKHTPHMTVKVGPEPIAAIRLELLNDPNLPRGGPGRSIKGTGALTELDVEAAPADAPTKTTKIKFVRATADVNPPETPLDPIFDDKSGRKRVTGPIQFAIDGKDATAWGFDSGPGRRNQPRKAVFNLDKPVSFPAGTILTILPRQNHGGWNSDDNQNNNLGRFRLSVTSAPNAVADPVPQAVREILLIPREKRSPAQVAAIFSYWRTTVPEWSDANARIERAWASHPEGATQLELIERDQPRPTFVLNRGDFLKPTNRVEPGVPAFLNPLPGDPVPPRLAFARWLVARDSPTTARSVVNRIWQAYFGTGIVATSEDLGTQCEPPSHPELLDWLAVELMDSGWTLKHIHRLIVDSSAYRQSSRATPEKLAADPYNRLLSRGARYRVDAEVVRDIALESSGLLDPTVGGPSVSPPAPGFLFQPPASYGPKVWNEATGSARYRRALYTFRYRSVPYPMLQIFDAPNGDFACVRRPRSNTPLQALTTLNEPIFLECARALAWDAISSNAKSDRERLIHAFRRTLARPPAEPEIATLLDLFTKETGRFQAPAARPWDLAANDPAHPPKLPAGATPAALAAWTAVSRVILNLDETICRE